MAEFNIGQTFMDSQATYFDRATLQYTKKPKFYIALSSAKYDNDLIVCFVMNTEKRMHKYNINCNKRAQKFIISPNTFSFINDYTSIMLSQPCFYQLKEMYENRIKWLDQASDILCKQIKNCIDLNEISPQFGNLIKKCFKYL